MSGRAVRLLGELKRRRVFRVAVVYGAVAFVVAQAADIAFPALQLPAWAVTLVVVLAILGFPIALVLAWAFEITPDGVVRAADADAGAGGPAAGVETSRVPGGGWSAERIAAAAGVVVLAVAGGAFMVFGEPFQRSAAPVPGPASAAVATPAIDNSIAVLPFEDLSPERDQGWFSDGMTEDIQTQLSRIADLKVIGRTSVMRYKGSEKTAREIGAELAVATILEGSVRRLGDRVRVTAKLVHAGTDEQMWAESYDRDLTSLDIFRIQSEIAAQIADALQTRFSPEQRARLGVAPTASLTAYDLSLQARAHAHRLTREDLARAIALYRQALERDPAYATAHAELAFAFAAMEGYHGAGAHWLDSAEVAARKAIELDPAAADPHAALALVEWNSGRTADAIVTYRRALAIRPNDPMALWGLSFAHWLEGRLDEALRMSKRAVELDPASPHIATLLGRCLISIGDVAAGERWLRRALELQPDFPWAHQDLMWLLTWRGDYGRAEEQVRIAGALFPTSPDVLNARGLLALLQGDDRSAIEHYDRLLHEHPGWGGSPLVQAGFAHARLGADDRARELWRLGAAHAEASLRHGNADDHWWHFSLARIEALTGDSDAAIRRLQAVYDAGWRGYPVLDLAVDPMLASLHGDPRFQRIRTAMLDDIRRTRERIEREAPARGSY